MSATAVVALLLALTTAGSAQPPRTPAPASTPNPRPASAPAPGGAPARSAAASAPVVRIGGQPYVSTTDLARLLGASRFWRADTRKLVLRVGDVRVTLTVDNPFAVVGDRTWRLEGPVRSLAGEVHVPLGLLAVLPGPPAPALAWDEAASRVRRAEPPAGGAATLRTVGDVTRLAIPTPTPGEARVLARSRAAFRVLVPGAVASSPDSIPPDAHVRAVRAGRLAAGAVFELDLAPDVQGYRLEPDETARQVILSWSSVVRPGDESLPKAAPGGPNRLATIVIDPGHGGADAGVRAGGLAEKDVVLALARVLQSELERRTGARVMLTRSADEPTAQERRAQMANVANADLVLSLHVDGFPVPGARGATVWCPPAASGGGDGSESGLRRWRDVARRHGDESRALATSIARAFDARGLGSVRVRERLTVPMLGVNAPVVMIEVATLTSPEDRVRIEGADGPPAWSAAITDAVLEWQRHE